VQLYIESERCLSWQRPLIARYPQYLRFVGRPLKPPSKIITQSLSFTQSVTPKTHLYRIKQRVASYTTKVISQQKRKIGCHGNVPQHLWNSINYMILWAHPSPQPKQHLDRFNCFCTDDRRVSLYFQWDAAPPQKKMFLPMGECGPPSNAWFPGPT